MLSFVGKRSQYQVFNSTIKKERTRKNQQCLKKSIGTLILFGLFTYLVTQCFLNGNILNINESLENKISRLSPVKLSVGSGYFVDLQGCKIPSLDLKFGRITNSLNDDTTKCFQPEIKMKNNVIFFKIDKQNIQKFFNISSNTNIYCNYMPMHSSDNDENERKFTFKFDFLQPIKIKSENYLQLSCYYSSSNEKFYEYLHILNNYDEKQTSFKHHDVTNKISVMVIGLSSLSHLNFLRYLKKTVQLLSEFNAIEFYGYSKVGETSFNNLLPLLTGLDERELQTACSTTSKNLYKNCPFIWNSFKDYKTAYAEDLKLSGFLKHFPITNFGMPPANFFMKSSDYYMKRVIRSREQNASYPTVHYCYNLHPFDNLLQFIESITPNLLKHDFFSYFWSSSWNLRPHNKPVDNEFQKAIWKLNSSGILNKTILFLVSDEGSHSGFTKTSYQGIMEERQPFLFVVLPKWFEISHPVAVLNMRHNTRKLTTHFDLHETIRDLKQLYLLNNNEIYQRSKEIQESDIYPRGISLFLTVPNNRTCEYASIPYECCICHEKQFILTNDPKVQRAARYIINIIREKLEGFTQCRSLHLNSILYASIGSANKKVLKGIEDEYISDLTVRVQTKPGLAVYEAIVRMTSYNTYLVSNITAIKFNGKSNFCTDDINIRDYCYCSRR